MVVPSGKVEMRMNEKVLKFKAFLDVFKGR
jgi:hypothetical protein